MCTARQFIHAVRLTCMASITIGAISWSLTAARAYADPSSIAPPGDILSDVGQNEIPLYEPSPPVVVTLSQQGTQSVDTASSALGIETEASVPLSDQSPFATGDHVGPAENIVGNKNNLVTTRESAKSAALAKVDFAATKPHAVLASTSAPLADYTFYQIQLSYFQELNDLAHVNYCGPGAGLVAIAARINPPWPSMDTLASAMKTNQGKSGTYMSDMISPLNRYAHTDWYVLKSDTRNSGTLAYISRVDLSKGYAMITGIKTGGMPGWDRPVKHIVATVAYYKANNSTTEWLTYVETAAPRAGYTGSYVSSWTPASNMWQWVNYGEVNAQAW